MPYSVVITHYDDDYKCRGDWSSNSGPYLFTDEDEADAWLLRYLVQYIEQDLELDKLEEDGRLYSHRYCFTQSLKVKNSYRSNYDVVTEMAKILARGEFVPTRLDWDISKVTIDDKVKDLLEYGPHDDGREESCYSDGSDDEQEKEKEETDDDPNDKSDRDSCGSDPNDKSDIE